MLISFYIAHYEWPFLYILTVSFYEACYLEMCVYFLYSQTEVELLAQCANSLGCGDYINSVQEHLFLVQCFCIIFKLWLVYYINSNYF